MSKEVIKILDALAEKFGLAIDWTSANVLPYLQRLCGKYVTYEIATSTVWMIFGIGLLLFGNYMKNKAKPYLESGDADDCDFGFILMGLSIGAFIIGIAIIMNRTFNIVTCVTFPEKLIIKELTEIYSSMK